MHSQPQPEPTEALLERKQALQAGLSEVQRMVTRHALQRQIDLVDRELAARVSRYNSPSRGRG